MDRWIGADINSFNSTEGYPHDTFTTPNGHKVYVYNYGASFTTPTIQDGQTAYDVYGYGNKATYYGGQTVGLWWTNCRSMVHHIS